MVTLKELAQSYVGVLVHMGCSVERWVAERQLALFGCVENIAGDTVGQKE